MDLLYDKVKIGLLHINKGEHVFECYIKRKG